MLRVEFIEDPGKQYGDDELGAVVNIILRRRETGAVVFAILVEVVDAPFGVLVVELRTQEILSPQGMGRVLSLIHIFLHGNSLSIHFLLGGFPYL